MHVSPLYGTPVIDESNYAAYAKVVSADGCSETGYRARNWDAQPLGSIAGTTEYPRDLVYDEKQLKEIIQEQDTKESSLWHILKRGPNVWRNQSPTNYCWNFGVVHGVQAARIFHNLPPVLLSPFSSGCPADNFANRGGWGSQSLKQIINFGICEEKHWPSAPIDGSGNIESANRAAINRKWYTEEMKANALLYRVTEWYDFRPRDFLAKLSAIVRHIAVPSGYNWMGHEMCGVRAVVLSNGALGCVDLDSYGQNGNFNERALSASRGAGDDMVAPRIST